MKKLIEDLAANQGLQTAYSGSVRVMYVRGEKTAVTNFLLWARRTYPDLAFELKDGNNTSEFTTIAKKDLKTAPPSLRNQPLDKKEVFIPDPIQITEKEFTGVLDEATLNEIGKPAKKPTPEEVDAYLLANPVDRKAKGPYNTAAKHFDVKPDYIRGRWARLRELGKVEIETANA